MKKDGASPEAGKETVPEGLTEEDLRLGKRASQYGKFLCLGAAAVCVLMAVCVFLNVPWNMRYPSPGKYGGHPPIQLALSLPFVMLAFFYPKKGKKNDGHHMGRGSRIGYRILITVMVSCVVWAQVAMAEEILATAGVISGWWMP